MPEYNEDSDISTDQDGDSTLVRDLRNQLRAANKQIKSFEGEIGAIKTEVRSTRLSKLLSDHGVKDDRIAKFIPGDVEATEDAISAWLAENGEVFGIKPGAVDQAAQPPAPNQPAPGSTVPADVQAAWAALAGAEQAGQGFAPVGGDKLLADMAGLKGKGFDAALAALQNVVLPG